MINLTIEISAMKKVIAKIFILKMVNIDNNDIHIEMTSIR